MVSDGRYAINREARYGPLEVVDVPALFRRARTPVQPDPLPCERLRREAGRVPGRFHWHKHDDEDEFFHVVTDD